MHHVGVANPTLLPHSQNQQQRKQLLDLLTAAELQQYHSLLAAQLNVSTARQLKTVSDDDLVSVVGMSMPEVRRLRGFAKKMTGQSGALKKIKNILSKSTHDTSDLCCLPVSDNARSPTSFIIDQSDITISKELGRGKFGSVHGGTWITGSGSKLSIAVRKCSLTLCSSSPLRKDSFLLSAQDMHPLKHPNIVRLYGVSMTTSHILMIMEQAPTNQSLKSWLLQPTVNISLSCLVEYCRQISAAMSYLETSNFVHGDLCAKNVLVFNKDLVKVTDCGLGRALSGYGGSLLKGGGGGVDSSKSRISWLAPECLQSSDSSKFSTSSDVWSFSITMWEIFSHGKDPNWNSSDAAQILAGIVAENFLEQPQLCPKDFFSLLLDCWKVDPGQRPTFQQIANRLNKLNLVRLQVDADSVETKTSHMIISAGDIITILDSSSSKAPAAGWWKGLNETTNQVGFFNPVNMKLLPQEGSKPATAKTLQSSSSLLRKNKPSQKPKLTAGMISLPLNDLRHTSHVGKNGETFGCEVLPNCHIAATPLKDSTNTDQESIPPVYKVPLRSISGAVPSEHPIAFKGRELTPKLSIGSNLYVGQFDSHVRVKYSPSNLSMVSADLSHVTSMVSSDTLTDVSSLPGDLGSLSKSDYEDDDYVDDGGADDEETFDISSETGDECMTDETILYCGPGGGDNNDDDDDDDHRSNGDSLHTIEEPQTPKILDASSSLFDEVMLALGGSQTSNKTPANQKARTKQATKKPIFDLSDTDEKTLSQSPASKSRKTSIDKSQECSRKIINKTSLSPVEIDLSPFRKRLASSEPCLDDKQIPACMTSSMTEDTKTSRDVDEDHRSVLRNLNGHHHLVTSSINVCNASFTTCSTTSLMSSSSDHKSSDSSVSSDVVHPFRNGRSSTSVLAKIGNALNVGRPRSKDHRRLSQASTLSRFSMATSNTSGMHAEQVSSNSKLSSSSFSGFDGRKQRTSTVHTSEQDKYPSYLTNKPKNQKNSSGSNKTRDRLRRSSLILVSMFNNKKTAIFEEKHRRTGPGSVPTSNFNTNESFFSRLREQEMEIAEKSENNSMKRDYNNEEAESEDSGIVLPAGNSSSCLNTSSESVPPVTRCCVVSPSVANQKIYSALNVEQKSEPKVDAFISTAENPSSLGHIKQNEEASLNHLNGDDTSRRKVGNSGFEKTSLGDFSEMFSQLNLTNDKDYTNTKQSSSRYIPPVLPVKPMNINGHKEAIIIADGGKDFTTGRSASHQLPSDSSNSTSAIETGSQKQPSIKTSHKSDTIAHVRPTVQICELPKYAASQKISENKTTRQLNNETNLPHGEVLHKSILKNHQEITKAPSTSDNLFFPSQDQKRMPPMLRTWSSGSESPEVVDV